MRIAAAAAAADAVPYTIMAYGRVYATHDTV